MSERKNKRESENIFEVEAEETTVVSEPTQLEIGSGYTLAVRYDEDQRPVVAVKTYGQVDHAQIRKEITRIFPDARIHHTNKTRSVKMARASRR